MKINCVELFHISIPFVVPYKLSKKYGTLTHAHAVMFKVHTDSGIVGLGEADPMNPFTEETPASVMMIARDHIVPLLLGKDPENIARIEVELDQKVKGNLTARGAVNMALFDIKGKACNIPVHSLLGGLYHAQLPLLSGIGSGTPKEDQTAIEELMKSGHQTVMIKMGTLPIKMEIERMISARKCFGSEIFFIVDANQAWTVFETLEFIEGCRGYMPDLIEQPVACRDIHGLKRIRERSPVPISADESMMTTNDAEILIRERAVDVLSIKVSKNGGISKAKLIAGSAGLFGHQCLMNSMLEFGITQAASLHIGCTLNNLLPVGHAYGSVLRMSDDITDFRKNISHGKVIVPMESGLGVNLDDQKLKKYTKDYLKIQ
ncbi:MAG: mandelate racemase [Proteobacteria bacterium]|nr:mandelate racemase [Pseudomonadota bacterium]